MFKKLMALTVGLVIGTVALADPIFQLAGGFKKVAYDNNGVYTIPPGDLPQFGQLARSAQMTAAFQDIAAALTYVYGINASPNLNASLLNSGTLPCAREPAHTGDVTIAIGTCTTVLAAAIVTNAKTAPMPATTVKCNPTGVLATAQDCAMTNALIALGVANAAGNWVIPAPSSGTALTMQQAPGAGISIADFKTNDANGGFFRILNSAGTVLGFIGHGSNTSAGATATDMVITAASGQPLQLARAGGTALALTVAVTGAVSIAPPSSGPALLAQSAPGTSIADFKTNDANGGFFRILNSASTTLGFIGHGSNASAGATATDMVITAASGQPLQLARAGGTALALTVISTGAVNIAAPSSGTSLTLSAGVANSAVMLASGNATAGQSFGPDFRAGTNSSDAALVVRNQSGATDYLRVRGDGQSFIYEPSFSAAALKNAATYEQGTYTGTVTGGTTAPTVTVRYSRAGGVVTLQVPTVSVTSNAVTFTLTGAPAGIRPTSTADIASAVWAMEDNGTAVAGGSVLIDTSGTLTFFKPAAVVSNTWTNAGTKAIGNPAVSMGISFTYSLN